MSTAHKPPDDASAATPARGARLLVVDDDADMLRLLSMRLMSAGYQVTAVTSAESALTQLEIEHPQLVLSDVRLPGRDGLALFDEHLAQGGTIGLRERDDGLVAQVGERHLGGVSQRMIRWHHDDGGLARDAAAPDAGRR